MATTADILLTADTWSEDVAQGAAQLLLQADSGFSMIAYIGAAKPAPGNAEGIPVDPKGTVLAAPILSPGDKVFLLSKVGAGAVTVVRAADRPVVTVGGQTRKIAATFNRPNDTAAYASGDLIANSVTAGAVAPMPFAVCAPGGSGQILRARIRKSSATVGATFRVHLYRSVPAPQGGDNAAWLTSGAFAYLGALDVTMDRAFTDGAAGNGVPLTGSVINFDFSGSPGTTLYGLLEARSAYTPGVSETFEVDLEIMRD